MSDTKISALTEVTNPSDSDVLPIVSGGATKSVKNQNVGMLRKVGTALIGGDFTGNARGADAIDIQTHRGAVTEVANGATAIAIGYETLASGVQSIAIGRSAAANGDYGIAIGAITAAANNGTAIGANSAAGGEKGTAVGYGGQATALKSSAIGYKNTADYVGSTAVGYKNRANAIYGVAVGYKNHVTAKYGAALGGNNLASGYQSTAVGYANHATASGALAIGTYSTAGGANSSAIGAHAHASVDAVTVIAPPIAIPKATGQFALSGGVEVVLMTASTDLTAVADVTLTLPAGAHFWLDEVGVICTALDTMTVQPTIRFGITGTLAKQKAAAITTLLTAVHKREKYTPLVPQDGEATLTAGVTAGATAVAMNGRYYFKGLLVEDQ